ncbi:MAG: 4-hydroxythreonine-4-phosphate dehydrogenase PdxA [Hyphomicrobium sp.]
MISQNSQSTFKPIAVTMGDPSGIGPEIIIKSYVKKREYSLPPFVVFGCPKTIKARARLLNLECAIKEVASVATSSPFFTNELPVIPVNLIHDATPGKPNPENAKSIIECITMATQATINGDAAAIVTNPISKAVLHRSGFKYPGHTEFLAYLAETYTGDKKFLPIMMLVSQHLRVVPVTIHIPVSEIPTHLSPSLIEQTLKTTWESLKYDFGIKNPRISVSGLNPHAGEDGTIGREEIVIIKPIIEKLKVSGINARGPYSADSLFTSVTRTTYDAAVCMYHDQALIPLKTLDFESGVNVTLGLPFVRTSPDHGTAFEISNSGIASPNSFISAIKLASEISERRQKQFLNE